MHRLWVRWTLLIVFVAILGTTFVLLGRWQLDRLHQRQARNAVTVANEAKPVQSFTGVFTHPISDADAWQQVQAQGTFDPDHQLIVRYRSNNDDNGYDVVTPLRTASGTVLVDRGFLSLQSGSPIPTTAPAPPTGEVTVVGRVQRNEEGRSSAVTPVDGAIRLISSDAIGPTLPYPVLNGYISLMTVTPGQTGGFQQVALPEISNGPHFWYAVQWFMFAGIGVAGIVVFIRGDLRERRTGERKPAPTTPGKPKQPRRRFDMLRTPSARAPQSTPPPEPAPKLTRTGG